MDLIKLTLKKLIDAKRKIQEEIDQTYSTSFTPILERILLYQLRAISDDFNKD